MSIHLDPNILCVMFAVWDHSITTQGMQQDWRSSAAGKTFEVVCKNSLSLWPNNACLVNVHVYMSDMGWWNRTFSCWQCKRMVLQYVPLVLVNGEKFLEKNDVCAMIQACDAGKRKAFNLFSARKLVRDAWSSRKRAYTNQVVVGMEKTKKWWQLVHMVVINDIGNTTLWRG